jgi:hypothetical protein
MIKLNSSDGYKNDSLGEKKTIRQARGKKHVHINTAEECPHTLSKYISTIPPRYTIISEQ